MSELVKKQKLVKILKYLIIVLLLEATISFGLSMFFHVFKEERILYLSPLILISIIRVAIDKMCTCNRCGYKMNSKEFIEKKDLLCPNGQDHDIF